MAAKRLLVLFNPRAHSGSAPDAASSFDAKLREAGFAATMHELRGGGDLDAAVDRYGAQCDAIVVGGGDGTVGSALPAVLRSGLPMGVWPLGTANDFARSLDIANDDDAVAALQAWDPQPIDVADVNGHYFINNATLGLPAEAAARLSPQLKRRFGVFASVALVPVLWQQAKPFDVEIETEARVERRRIVAALIGSGKYEGGFPVRYSALADGRLHLDVCTARSRWALLPILVDIALKRAGRSKRIETFAARRVTVRTPSPKRVAADGDITTQTPATIQVHPGAVRVFRAGGRTSGPPRTLLGP